MMGLGQHFRKMDSSGDGLLDRNELQKALEAYHIRIPDEVSKVFLDLVHVVLLVVVVGGGAVGEPHCAHVHVYA